MMKWKLEIFKDGEWTLIRKFNTAKEAHDYMQKLSKNSPDEEIEEFRVSSKEEN